MKATIGLFLHSLGQELSFKRCNNLPQRRPQRLPAQIKSRKARLNARFKLKRIIDTSVATRLATPS